LSNEDQSTAAQVLFHNSVRLAQEQGLSALEAKGYNAIGKSFQNQPDSTLLYYQRSIDLAQQHALHDIILTNKIQQSRIFLHQKKYETLASLFNELIPTLESHKDWAGMAETYTYM